MIEWRLHPEPYTKNSSENRKNPEGFLWYSPPFVDGFQLIYPHDSVGKEVDEEEEIGEHSIYEYKIKNFEILKFAIYCLIEYYFIAVLY